MTADDDGVLDGERLRDRQDRDAAVVEDAAGGRAAGPALKAGGRGAGEDAIYGVDAGAIVLVVDAVPELVGLRAVRGAGVDEQAVVEDRPLGGRRQIEVQQLPAIRLIGRGPGVV